MSSLSKRNYLDSPVKKRKTIKNEDMTNSLHDDDVNPIESSKNTAINEAEFDIFVSKSDFKFNCAHFIAYKGFRERLHGHNYRISIKVTGKSGGILSEDGYLIDFGDIKVAARDICKSLNEFFICPMKSDAIEIKDIDNSLCLTCEDGAKFVFPKTDCAQLPIYHSSAEEISHYIYCEVIRKIGIEKFIVRGIKSMEVTVAEAPLQQAVFRCPIPENELSVLELEKPRIRRPMGCFDSH